MSDLTARTWGRGLREQRKARQWTIEQVASRVGVSPQAVSKWERGAAKPTTDNQARLAGLFGCTVPMLFPVTPVVPSDRGEWAA